MFHSVEDAAKDNLVHTFCHFGDFLPPIEMETSQSATDYKRLKEDFVSNLSGGPIGEINYVTAVAPVCPRQTPPSQQGTGC